jgi:hypothetical protein
MKTHNTRAQTNTSKHQRQNKRNIHTGNMRGAKIHGRGYKEKKKKHLLEDEESSAALGGFMHSENESDH